MGNSNEEPCNEEPRMRNRSKGQYLRATLTMKRVLVFAGQRANLTCTPDYA